MRALATISAVVLLGANLAGCDMPGSHQQQAAAAPPPCNCAPPPPPAAAMPPPPEHMTRLSYAPRHHTYGHRYYAEARHIYYRSRYETDRAQQSVDAYDYQSSSRVTRSDYSESGYGGGRIVWVDGYGRGYFSNGPVTVAATMRGKRLAPYHGYDVDCPDDGEPH
jgi:hypothetical protein